MNTMTRTGAASLGHSGAASINMTLATTACRHCGAALTLEACDLGDQPLANNLVPLDAPAEPDRRFPLKVMVCAECLLVQLEKTVSPSALFCDYSYMSSISSVWHDHAQRFAEKTIARFGLNASSHVIEVGSNDGTLLRYFQQRGVQCLGIDPAANIGAVARRNGVPTLTEFFGEATAAGLPDKADLLVANNVAAHVPDLMDFVRGLSIALAPQGVLSIEVQHVLAIMRHAQFDTIYHEHVFYHSALVLKRVLASVGLDIFDIELLPTHGGSLRVFAQHTETGRQPHTSALETVIATEREAGLDRPETYRALAQAASRVIDGLQTFLRDARLRNLTVAAHGAAAKGTMLLNAAGATAADIAFIADGNPLKQGRRIPGCRIPIVAPDQIQALRPDYLLVLPWNIAGEIMQQTRFIAAWGGRFVIPSPELRIVAA
jgi:trans-aconitate methyltransferase